MKSLLTIRPTVHVSHAKVFLLLQAGIVEAKIVQFLDRLTGLCASFRIRITKYKDGRDINFRLRHLFSILTKGI